MRTHRSGGQANALPDQRQRNRASRASERTRARKSRDGRLDRPADDSASDRDARDHAVHRDVVPVAGPAVAPDRRGIGREPRDDTDDGIAAAVRRRVPALRTEHARALVPIGELVSKANDTVGGREMGGRGVPVAKGEEGERKRKNKWPTPRSVLLFSSSLFVVTNGFHPRGVALLPSCHSCFLFPPLSPHGASR